MRLLKTYTAPWRGYQIEKVDPEWVEGPRSCRHPLCPFKVIPECIDAVEYWKGPELERTRLTGSHWNTLIPNHPCMALVVRNRYIYNRSTGTVHWCRVPGGAGCTNIYHEEHVREHNSYFWVRRNPWPQLG
jgi:hypothetical protein